MVLSINIVVLTLGMCFFVSLAGDPLVLHILTPSFPTRRASDLLRALNDLLSVGWRAISTASMGSGVLIILEKYGTETTIEEMREALGYSGLTVVDRSEEHTSELQSLMRISYAVFCLTIKKKNSTKKSTDKDNQHDNRHNL